MMDEDTLIAEIGMTWGELIRELNIIRNAMFDGFTGNDPAHKSIASYRLDYLIRLMTNNITNDHIEEVRSDSDRFIHEYKGKLQLAYLVNSLIEHSKVKQIKIINKFMNMLYV